MRNVAEKQVRKVSLEFSWKLKCLEIECQSPSKFFFPKGTFNHLKKYKFILTTALLEFTIATSSGSSGKPRTGRLFYRASPASLSPKQDSSCSGPLNTGSHIFLCPQGAPSLILDIHAQQPLHYGILTINNFFHSYRIAQCLQEWEEHGF